MPKEEMMKSGDDDALFCLTKHIDPKITCSTINNSETSGYDYGDDRVCENKSKNEGTDPKFGGFQFIYALSVSIFFFFNFM